MKKDMWQLIRDELGFSLPEIMVGSAILAGVALAGATIFRNQARSQARAEHDQTLNSYHASLAKQMANDHNCNATMRSWNQYGRGIVGDTDFLAGVYYCSGVTCHTDFDASNTNAGGCLIKEGLWIDQDCDPTKVGKRIWKLDKIYPVSGINKTGILRLRFEYIMNPDLDSRRVIKDINLNLRFNEDAVSGPVGFKECYSENESSINNLQKDLCKSMFNNFTNVGSDGGLVIWNEATQSCDLNGTPDSPLKNCSAQGLMVAGIRSDGTVHCRSVSVGFNPTPVTDSAACTATSKVKLDWVGSKVKATCVP
jgi:prepilin-type N-terminal cleavage/methylation domain-containing protein